MVPGELYTFRVSVSDDRHGAVSVYIQVEVDEPPFISQLQISPTVGLELETVFTVFCIATDPDIPIEYRFETSKHGPQTVDKPLGSWTIQAQMSFQLAEGTHTVIAEVRDSIGSASKLEASESVVVAERSEDIDGCQVVTIARRFV